MPWNRLLSLFFPLALLLLGGAALAHGLGERRLEPEVVTLKGSVEVDRLEAIRTLEHALDTFVRERYQEIWGRASGILVPKALLSRELERRIERRWKRLPFLTDRKIQVFETTAGKAFRGEYRVILGGDEERQFLRWTKGAASQIGERTRTRLLIASLLSLLLLFLTGRLDLMTRGYLTKRLYFLSFLLSGFLFWGYGFQGMGGLV
ncbi:MAG TPA: hypothetical protein ENK02_07650 [Planctomycetes bacterium]|nr:hypothetical protein [Planctomycetota bacterium]